MAKVNLFPDFKAFLGSLNSANVRYLILGGYSVIHYGYARSTADLDVWIALDLDNLKKVSQVLQSFAGFPAKSVSLKKLSNPDLVLIFGREPVRIDILTGPSGIDFDACYESRNVAVWDGITVPVIGLEDLKRNKRASGRAKDLADLENLPEIAQTAKQRVRRGRKKKK